MDDKKMEKEFNLKIAKVGKKDLALKDLLMLYDKEELEEICYCLRNEKTLSKNKLVEFLCKELVKEETIDSILSSLLTSEWKKLNYMLEKNGIEQDDYIKYYQYHIFVHNGLMYLINDNGKIYMVIPKEILNVIKKMDLSKYHDIADKGSVFYDIAEAMLNLYGIVDLDYYVDYLHAYFDNIDLSYYGPVLAQGRSNDINIYHFDDDTYLVKDEYYDEFEFILRKYENTQLNHIPKKVIDLHDLLKYKDIIYYQETEGSKALLKYLKKKGIKEPELTVACLIQTFKSDYLDGINMLNDELFESDFELNDKNYSEVIHYINDIVNEIPIWGNNGWSNKEIILEKWLDE